QTCLGKGTSMNRVRGLERVFYRAAGFVLPDLEPSARSRLELVSLIERLRRVGLPVAVACAVAGVSRASYYRWRYRLRRGGARALTDGRSRNRRRRAAPVRSVAAGRSLDRIAGGKLTLLSMSR